MKLSDLGTVKKLVTIRENLTLAREEATKYIDEVVKHGVDSGGVTGFHLGYNCVVTTHHDGSGPTIHLGGCYVAMEVADATVGIIDKKLSSVTTQLELYGVKVD